MRSFGSIAALLLLAGCATRPKELVCPPVINWSTRFMKGVAAELVAHPEADMPYFHALAQKALAQHRIDKSCQ